METTQKRQELQLVTDPFINRQDKYIESRAGKYIESGAFCLFFGNKRIISSKGMCARAQLIENPFPLKARVVRISVEDLAVLISSQKDHWVIILSQPNLGCCENYLFCPELFGEMAGLKKKIRLIILFLFFSIDFRLSSTARAGLRVVYNIGVDMIYD